MKSDRHNRIIKLVSENDIETQEELAAYLKEEGYSVTQATVSRDINKLGLVKVPGKQGRQKYAVPQDAEVGGTQYMYALKDAVISIERAENIIVIKTAAGMAMAVAAAIDALKIDDIAGSIAGDDTIMCAVKKTELADSVIGAISKYIL